MLWLKIGGKALENWKKIIVLKMELISELQEVFCANSYDIVSIYDIINIDRNTFKAY